VSWSPAEFIATTGLLVIVFGCARSARAQTGPFAVGTWVVAAAATVPSAFMNPALSLGALLASGPAALNGAAFLTHVPSQCAGALLAFGIVRAAYYSGAKSAAQMAVTS
jgi:arsenate reductase